MAREQGDLRQRLGVEDQRGAALEAAAPDGHERVGGYAGPAVELVDQRGLLAGDEVSREGPDLDPGLSGRLADRLGRHPRPQREHDAVRAEGRSEQ